MAALIPAIGGLLTAAGALLAAIAAKVKADNTKARVEAHIKDCHPEASSPAPKA